MRCMRYWCDAKLVDSAATYPARTYLARSACRSFIAAASLPTDTAAPCPKI